MKTLRVCVMFLICAMAFCITSPPIVTRGYLYNLDPRKNYLRVSRPLHQILKGEKPNRLSVSSHSPQPHHPIVTPDKPKIQGASPRVFGLHDLKYLEAKPDTPVYMEVIYLLTMSGVIVGICVFCIPMFYFFKELINKSCIDDPDPPQLPEVIITQHM